MMDENAQAFEALLLRLEPGFADSGKRYKQLRLKMVKFFGWKRCEDPESLADETIRRMVKNLSAGEAIRINNPYAYIYAIAKHVFMEYLREKRKREAMINNLPDHLQSHSEEEEDCRKECLRGLSRDNRSLLQRYYASDEARERLAESLNLTLNALRLRIHRLKQELRACEECCLDNSRRR